MFPFSLKPLIVLVLLAAMVAGCGPVDQPYTDPAVNPDEALGPNQPLTFQWPFGGESAQVYTAPTINPDEALSPEQP
jgi:hypothetical protein